MRVWFAAFAAMIGVFGAQAAEKLPTDYGDPANDLASDSVEGLTWTCAARAYKIENDIVLVFTNTTAGSCSFEIAPTYLATGRYLLVGGGGPGGCTLQRLAGGGGGAGGFVEAEGVRFENAVYSVTVGAGGVRDGDEENRGASGYNANGKPSMLGGGKISVKALGGGGGGISNGKFDWKYGCGNPYPIAETDVSKADVACGGGGAAFNSWGTWYDQPGGMVVGDQGCNGGRGMANADKTGGGGGAGAAGANASDGGSGGDGKASDITGEEVWYAGGGGGGLNGDWSNSNKAPGGKGGGGMAFPNGYDSPVVAISYSGVDTLGGGGAGTCFAKNNSGNAVSPSGNGGNGVVIVRFSKVEKPTPVEGFTFSGESEWFNIGEGDEKETVVVFKDTAAAASFSFAHDAVARILVVGGGGPGGNHNQGRVLGGGGAGGGVVDAAYADYYAGTYAVTVGKGGVANGDYNNPVFNNNGAPSFITRGGADVLRALGGGGGGVPNNSGNWKVACGNPYGYCTSDDDKSYDFTKVDVANGGGAAICGGQDWCDAQHPGKVGELGHEGGKAVKCDNTFEALLNAGGGAGAGENGHDATGYGASGAGGNGVVSDITGAEVYYGGGGAGGTFGTGSGVTALVNGGLGGGGKAYVDDSTSAKAFAENGVDGLGGGGAGASLSGGTSPRTKAFAGRGGNGVVIVRVKKVYPAEEPLDGVSFTGAAEWFNLGHGKTRETVIVYTNVNENGTLTFARRATARVLLVGGGGPGGYTGAYNLLGGGGGAGGVVSNDCAGTKLRRGTYEIVVGKGGSPSDNRLVRASNGGDSVISREDDDLFRAFGGGAGGNANGDNKGDSYDNSAWGANGGCGGGGATYYNWYNKSGEGGTGSQGCSGGKARNNGNDDAGYYLSPGGGGGAGTAGGFPSALNKAGVGGDGIVSDITGEEVWYAGGGAGGTWGNWGKVETAGGKGGGGATRVDTYITPNFGKAENGVDGLGGGGGGSSGGTGSGGNQAFAPGRGGNGVVIVRIIEVQPLGLSVIMQ